MDKNNKVKDFFRKEGFYFVLFICLCVVATVAAFTIRNNSTAKEQNQANNDFTLNTEEYTSDESFDFKKQNADRVENNDALAEENNNQESEVVENTDEVAEVNETVDEGEVAEAETEENYVDVSAGTTEVMFVLPVDVNAEAISRKFGAMVRTYEDASRSEDNTRRGIDLNASAGTVVKAAAEGKVEEVSKNTTDGNYIVVSHANGLKTKYANLSDEVYVAVGDTVAAGTEIGTVGNSSGIFTAQICGDVLNLQVQDANGNDVDPEAYFNFQ